MFNRFFNYVKETKTEMSHVSWPTRKQAIVFTTIVIAISILVALFLGFFDFIFTNILKNFI